MTTSLPSRQLDAVAAIGTDALADLTGGHVAGGGIAEILTAAEMDLTVTRGGRDTGIDLGPRRWRATIRADQP